MLEWTDKLKSEIEAFLREGVPYSKIAATLTTSTGIRVTKNMVVGAAHRYGIAKRVRIPNVRAKKGRAARTPPLVSRTRGQRPLRNPTPDYSREETSLIGKCLYIAGEPKDREFCCKPAVLNPYRPHRAPVWCAEHLNIVYIPKGAKATRVMVKKGRSWVTETKWDI